MRGAALMKPSAIRIERMLEKLEARVAPPERPVLCILIHAYREKDDNAEAIAEEQEKAIAEHVACHPEDAGRTVKDFRWVIDKIVHYRPSETEISEAAMLAAEKRQARDEITKDEIEDEFKSISLNGCKGTDGPSEMSEPIDLAPPDPGCLARSKPWRPVHQRPARDQRRPTWKKWER